MNGKSGTPVGRRPRPVLLAWRLAVALAVASIVVGVYLLVSPQRAADKELLTAEEQAALESELELGRQWGQSLREAGNHALAEEVEGNRSSRKRQVLYDAALRTELNRMAWGIGLLATGTSQARPAQGERTGP